MPAAAPTLVPVQQTADETHDDLIRLGHELVEIVEKKLTIDRAQAIEAKLRTMLGKSQDLTAALRVGGPA